MKGGMKRKQDDTRGKNLNKKGEETVQRKNAVREESARKEDRCRRESESNKLMEKWIF